MTIIFYDSDNEQIYVCTETERMKIVSLDDPNLLDYLPNNDILYVKTGQFMTKSEFSDLVNGVSELPSNEEDCEFVSSENMTGLESDYKNSLYIHPRHNGTILIQDLPNTSELPGGILELNGKYDFKCIDFLGGQKIFDQSAQYRSLVRIGKIKVVDYDYMKRNVTKKHNVSARDLAADRILIKDDVHGTAEKMAASGGMQTTDRASDEVVPIYVEGD